MDPVLPIAFDRDDAVRVAHEVFGIAAEAKALPSYADRNFLLQNAKAKFVLKIARPGEADGELDLQNQALRHLEARAVPGPRLVAAPGGEDTVWVPDGDGGRLRARLVTWIEGATLAEEPPSPTLLTNFGRFLARLDRALADFAHPFAHRAYAWDLAHALDARVHIDLLHDPERRSLVTRRLDDFERRIAPRYGSLPQQVVHNDANDHNVLVRGDEVVAMIDFGDMVSSARVADPAIALAYVMLDTPDPCRAAQTFLSGYLAELPLSAQELEVLPDLVATRLVVSVLSSTRAKLDRPDDPYLDVTEPHAWALLERFESPSAAERWEAILPR